MFLRLLGYNIIKNKDFYDRDIYPDVLSDPKSILGKRLRDFVSFCVVVGVLIIIFETIPWIEVQFGLHFFVLDIFVSSVFAIEYIYRFIKSQHKKDFTINIFNIIDLLSFLPFFIGLIFQMFAGLDILKVLRLFRLLRLFEVSSHSPITLGFLRTIKEYKSEYKAVGSIFISTLIVVSSLVYYFEFPENPGFSTIPESLWWGIVTMTTVGYGDLSPVTTAGKLFGTVLILLGPVLLAVIGSITILVFMDVAEAQKQADTKLCQLCKTRNPQEANFCYNCGKEHFMADEADTRIESEKPTLIQKIFTKL